MRVEAEVGAAHRDLPVEAGETGALTEAVPASSAERVLTGDERLLGVGNIAQGGVDHSRQSPRKSFCLL